MMTVNEKQNIPVVLVIGGNDPVGGAGLCADIQALAGMGCHAAPVVTAVTSQTTCGVRGYMAVDASLVTEQIACVLEEFQVAAIKTGMLVSPEIVEGISGALADCSGIPLVVDPVLASNRGNSLSEHSLLNALSDSLARQASVLTPNLPELEALTACSRPDGQGAGMLCDDLGADILLTGTHDSATDDVVNRLFRPAGRDAVAWRWPRLPGEYHGSGCTLASALAAGLAHGLDIVEAAGQAQEFTWQALKKGIRTGHCQDLPNRIIDRSGNGL